MPMDRDEMCRKMAEYMKECPEDKLQRMAEMMDGRDSDMDDDRADAHLAKYLEDDMPEGEEGASQYREKHRKYSEFVKKFGERIAKKYGEVSSETAMGSPKKEEEEEGMPVKMSELRKMVRDEVNAVAPKLGAKIDAIEKLSEQKLASSKEEIIDRAMEANVHRIAPAIRDSVRARLMRADAVTKIEKFTEANGKVKHLTDLEVQIHEIAQWPVLGGRNGTAKSSNGQSGKPAVKDADPEIQKLSEAFDRFEDDFPKGQTKESLIAGYKAEREIRPRLQAADFCELVDML